jgi:hypothetical protein
VGTLKGRNRKGQAMSTKTMKNVIALGAAGLLGLGGAFAITTASPSWAMPVLSNTVVAGTAASTQITEVRYYGRGYGHRGYYGRGYARRGYYRRGYGYPYGGYAYPYAYPYYSPLPFGYGWGGW